MKTIPHELFHQFQYAYTPNPYSPTTLDQEDWIDEGTARWTEDLVLDSLNDYAISANVYLEWNTNIDIRDIDYESVLFWKYLTEQFGQVKEEPQIGVDLMLDLWKNWSSLEGIEGINHTLSTYGTDFDQVFTDFFVYANYLKKFDKEDENQQKYDYLEDELYDDVKITNAENDVLYLNESLL
ncbi:MAG: hypothetical protein HYZ66_01810, partial [Chlamydiae bacterium]|nr:hypothetical protein [Chlamydiota bacterium]